MNDLVHPLHLPLRLAHCDPRLARLTLVDWTLGNSCNYACSYCPKSLHDGSIPWTDPQAILAFCDRLIAHYAELGQSLLFQFSGGEPTVYPHFLPLIRHLHGWACKVAVISNASRTRRWWEEARGFLDQAVLTHHIEFVELNHFMEIAQLLADKIRTHVNVTMHPERFDECLDNARRIAGSCQEITLTLKPLLIDFGAVPYAYSDAQRQIIAQTHFEIRRSRPVGESRGAMRIIYADGSAEIRRPAELIITGQNHFNGWACHAGLELLCIDPSGKIYRGLCRQGGMIGRIDDAELNLPDGPVTCTREICHCATDLMTTRYRNDDAKMATAATGQEYRE
jgi:organic radical activating enzyme